MEKQKSRSAFSAKTALICFFCALMLAVPLFASGKTAGDFDGDGDVTSADAVRLLRSVLLPESYPLAQNGDVNGDGEVSSADAVYLLRHVLLPEQYPLASDRAAEEESETIAGAVDAAMTSGEYTYGFWVNGGFPSDMTEEWLGGKLLDAFGLGEGYSLEFDADDFSVLKEKYAGHTGAEREMAFTVRGENGGSCERKWMITVYCKIEDYLKTLIIDDMKESGLWDGMLSHDGEFTLELTTDFPTLDELTVLLSDALALGDYPHGIKVTVSVDDEYYGDLKGYYEEAEIGEEVEEWLEVTVEAQASEDGFNYVWHVSHDFRFGITRLMHDCGFAETDDGICYNLFGCFQKGWRKIGDLYYFFDENGILDETAQKPEGLSDHFDAEEDRLYLIKDGEFRFALIHDDDMTSPVRAEYERLVEKLEAIAGKRLPENNRLGHIPSGAEGYDCPKIIFGTSAERYFPEYLTGANLLNFKVMSRGDDVAVFGYSERSSILTLRKFCDMIDEYADGDDLPFPETDGLFEIECEESGKTGIEKYTVTYYHGPYVDEFTPEIMKDIADCGFTRIALTHRSEPLEPTRAVLELAGEYGLEVSLWERGMWHYNGTDDFSEETLENYLKEVYGHWGDREEIVEWWICDEPIPAAFANLEKSVRIWNQLDPARAAAVNLGAFMAGWEENWEQYFGSFVDTVRPGYISFDLYPLLGDPPTLDPVGNYFAQIYFAIHEAMARIGIERGVDTAFINALIDSGAEEESNNSKLEYEQLLWEINVNLAYGHKCVSFFTCRDLKLEGEGYEKAGGTIFDVNYQKTPRYYALQRAVRETTPIGEELFDRQLEMVYHLPELNEAEQGKFDDIHLYLPYGDLGTVEGRGAIISFFRTSDAEEDGGSGQEFLITNREFRTGAEDNVILLTGGNAFEWFDPSDAEWKSAEECPVLSGTAGNYTLSLPSGASVLLRKAQ